MINYILRSKSKHCCYTWCTFTHIVSGAFWQVAHSIILTVVVFAGAGGGDHVIVRQGKDRRNLTELARKASSAHAGIGTHAVLARSSVQADMGLTIINILRAVLPLETRLTFTPVKDIGKCHIVTSTNFEGETVSGTVQAE